MTGFDSLVDLLMSMDGYDRDEAELIAEARLAAGDDPNGAKGKADRLGRPKSAGAPAASFACDPCECGGLCDECEDHPYWDAVLDEFGGAASCEEPS